MKFAVVVVTYNRLTLLKQVIDGFFNQTSKPDIFIIVNNCSTDNTKEYLDELTKTTNFKGLKVINSDKNLGGSGGFNLGTREAVKLGADWVWASDDDAIPDIRAVELAKNYIKTFGNEDISAFCGQVQVEGKIDVEHRKRIKLTPFMVHQVPVPIEEYKREYFNLDCISYVGIIMNANSLKKVGYIDSSYFIWHDDYEHCLRLAKSGQLRCYPKIIIDHKAKQTDYIPLSWKTFYGYRNDLVSLKRHFPKRYFVVKELRIMQKAICSRDRNTFKLSKHAITSAKLDKMGVDNIYKPGWKND